MLHALLIDGAGQLGVKISSDDASRFMLYMDELIFWNEKVNLTSIKDKKDVVIKHFLDSLAVAKAIDVSKGSMLDVGAGAGFPGIPLKMAFPDINLVLIDSVRKKTDFLNHIITLLDLTNTKTVWSRVEDYALKERGKFDFTVARALAPLNILIELCVPPLKKGGTLIAMKSDKTDEELAQAENALKELKAEISGVVKVSLPFTDITRNIVLIKKTGDTPEKYPRRAGIPKKDPL